MNNNNGSKKRTYNEHNIAHQRDQEALFG